MQIALAQIDVTVGDIEGNLKRCLDAVASARGADVVVLPELALTGFPPGDLLLRNDFVERSEDALRRFASQAVRPAVVGCVERSAGALRNAAAYVADGRVCAVHHKRSLARDIALDEERYFEAGRSDTIVEIAGSACAITIGEELRPPEVAQRLAETGAQVLVNLSAKAFCCGEGKEREAALQAHARRNGVWVASCNLIGGQDELVFEGRSGVFAPDGSIIARAASFAEDTIVCGAGAMPSRTTAGAQLRPAPEGAEETYLALVLGLADYVRKNRFSDVVVGLSGGIDSALVAVIAADALGGRHVHGVLMPGPYSSAGSLSDAQALADNLRLDAFVLPIDGVHAELLGSVEPALGGVELTVVEENLQARERGMLLMALSNANGWLVLAPGNKSELAVGYCTLYGDMAGGFAPIKDVFKTQVYELARWRDSTDPVIPASTLAKAPSAELRPDQTDEDSLPPYDVLDPILAGYLERRASPDELVAQGHCEEVVRRVVRMTDAAEHKRRQAAPGTRVSAAAFGLDVRMPMTNAFGR